MALETPTVSLNQDDAGYARPLDTHNQFAKGVAESGKGISDALNSFAETITAFQVKFEKEKAEAQALDTLNNIEFQLQENKREYSTLKNKDAIDNYDKYKANINSIIDGSLPGDDVQPLTKKLIDKKIGKLRLDAQSDLTAYQMQEVSSYKMLNMEASLGLSQNEALSQYGKVTFSRAMQGMLSKYDAIADAKGVDTKSEAYKLDRLKLTSSVHYNGILNFIRRENYGSAISNLNKYKNELTAEDYNKLMIDYSDAVARSSAGSGRISTELKREDYLALQLKFGKEFDERKDLHTIKVATTLGDGIRTLTPNDSEYQLKRLSYINSCVNEVERKIDQSYTRKGMAEGYVENALKLLRDQNPNVTINSFKDLLDYTNDKTLYDDDFVKDADAHIKMINHYGTPNGDFQSYLNFVALSEKEELTKKFQSEDLLKGDPLFSRLSDSQKLTVLQKYLQEQKKDHNAISRGVGQYVDAFIQGSMNLKKTAKGEDGFKYLLANELLNASIKEKIEEKKRQGFKNIDTYSVTVETINDPLLRVRLQSEIKQIEEDYKTLESLDIDEEVIRKILTIKRDYPNAKDLPIEEVYHSYKQGVYSYSPYVPFMQYY